MVHRVIAITLGAAILLAAVDAAQAKSPAARPQTKPAVAYNSSQGAEGFLVVWVEDVGDGSDIYAKRLFRGNGLPQGGPARGGWQVIRSSSFSGSRDRGPRDDPAIVYNSQQGEYVLVYSEYVGDEDGWDVFAVRVSSAGYSRTKPRLLGGGPGDQQHPDIATVTVSGRLEYLVVWDDNAQDIDEVWAVRMHSNGIPRGAPYRLFASQYNATDPTTNGTAVAWVDDRGGDTDIWGLRLKNGLPNGTPYRLQGTDNEDFNPRFGEGPLLWNSYNSLTGIDVHGAEVYNNNTTRGPNVGILVPAADQSWPDAASGIMVFADNRSGDFDLYGIRLTNIRSRGREFPILTDYTP
ncbi:MAG: hypothetical protein ACK2T6_02165 [Anaerolineae bacterium]